MAKTLNKKLQDVAAELRELTQKLDALMNALGVLEDAAPEASGKPAKTKTGTRKTAAKKSPAKKTASKKAPTTKAAAPKKAAAKKAAPKKKAKTALDTVLMFIGRTKKGLDTEALMKKTGFDRKKVSNAIYKLKKQGKIVVSERGKYLKA